MFEIFPPTGNFEVAESSLSRYLPISVDPDLFRVGRPDAVNGACAKTEVENDQTNVKTDEVTIGAMDVALVTTQLPKRVR